MTAATVRLEPFVGTFKAVVKLWMGPGEPMVSTGRTNIRATGSPSAGAARRRWAALIKRV